MARAAVKAKQQARAQTAKPTRARGRRRHSGGGNPNQQLFFVRLRRGQKWLYGTLALVFAIGFVGVGVGSGNGGGLSQLYTGLFGGGGSTSVSKAQDEIKKDPAKGYRDLATAYEQNGNTLQAANALQTYLTYNKKDAAAWGELGGLELSQGGVYAKQYQSAQTTAQNADPSAPFQPGGPLATAVGSNAAYQGASQQATTGASLLYQKATTSFQSAVTDYRTVAKLKPRSVTAWQELASAAENAGNAPLAIRSLKQVLKIDPSTPLKPQIQAQLKALTKSQPSASSGSGG
jgi:tetratricopeptide (TPR) repeat protein